MKSILVSLLLVAVLYAEAASAGQQGVRIKGKTAEEQAQFIQGVAMGVAFMYGEELKQAKPTFCPPANFQFSTKNIWEVANSILAAEPFEPEVFTVSVVMALKEKFPCATQ